ncbi:MAG: hypothetical protein MHPSP_001498 [Paramarteilia canceri]
MAAGQNISPADLISSHCHRRGKSNCETVVWNFMSSPEYNKPARSISNFGKYLLVKATQDEPEEFIILKSNTKKENVKDNSIDNLINMHSSFDDDLDIDDLSMVKNDNEMERIESMLLQSLEDSF